jgi:ribosomal protein S18 acetylase RimI-like enzyme
MIIEISQLSDLNKLAECHKKAFPNSLSSQMGNLFIKKMLSWYIFDERGVLFHVTEKNEVVGYCGGVITMLPGLPGAATSITQFSFRAFIISFMIRPWLILHPENTSRFPFIIKNILMKIRLKNHIKTTQNTQENFQTFWGLVVIGVIPKFHGKGFGSFLLQEFERLARLDKVDKISLSVKSDNLKAINSYKANGWQVSSTNSDSLNLMKKL